MRQGGRRPVNEFEEEEKEEDYKAIEEYKSSKLKISDEGRINIAVNDLIQDLKSKEIDFEKTFANKAGFYTDQGFIALLEKLEYRTASPDQLDMLRAAFRDDKERSKLSVNKMRQRFNIVDPSFLKKTAVKSEADAKQRLLNLPQNIKDYITRIDNYFKRKNLDVKQVFKEMDKNQDGTISEQEFTRVLMKTYKVDGFNITKFREVYMALDINKDNSISIGEFMYYFEGAKRTEEERRQMLSKDAVDQMKYDIGKMFEEFDTGNKGFLVQDDLYKILKAAGLYLDKNT